MEKRINIDGELVGIDMSHGTAMVMINGKNRIYEVDKISIDVKETSYVVVK